MEAIKIKDLSHTFPPRRKATEPRTALDRLSLSIGEREIFGLLGPNGSGKTTLFRILSTLLEPTSGVALLFGIDVTKNPAAARQKIGVVFQHPSLDDKLTVVENMRHQGHLYDLSGAPLKVRIDELLTHFQMSDRAGDFVEHLSGGLKRRIEIAKGLLHKPSLLLMDEPSTGLDPGARRDMWEMLSNLKTEGVSIVLTTHLMEEGDRCDRLAIIHKGRVVTQGTPDELKKKIGGDIISIHAKDPSALLPKLKSRFGGNPLIVEDVIRLEIENGHQVIPSVVEAFPGVIEAITLGKPTLEDVFVHETGERIHSDDISEERL